MIRVSTGVGVCGAQIHGARLQPSCRVVDDDVLHVRAVCTMPGASIFVCLHGRPDAVAQPRVDDGVADVACTEALEHGHLALLRAHAGLGLRLGLGLGSGLG